MPKIAEIKKAVDKAYGDLDKKEGAVDFDDDESKETISVKLTGADRSRRRPPDHHDHRRCAGQRADIDEAGAQRDPAPDIVRRKRCNGATLPPVGIQPSNNAVVM